MNTPTYKPSNVSTVFHLREKVPHLSQYPDRIRVYLFTGSSYLAPGKVREFWRHQDIESSTWILTMVDPVEKREIVIAWSYGTPKRKFGTVAYQLLDAWGMACLRNQADSYTQCAEFESDMLPEMPGSCLQQPVAAGSPLHEAAETGDWTLSAWLLNRGDDVKRKDVLGRTPLHVAVQHDRWDVARLILTKDRHGMAQDPDGRTAWDLQNSPVRKILQPESDSVPSMEELDVWRSLPDSLSASFLSVQDLAAELEKQARHWSDRGEHAVAALFALRIVFLKGAGTDVIANALSLWSSLIPKPQREQEWSHILHRLLTNPGIPSVEIALAICRCEHIRDAQSLEELEQAVALMQSALSTKLDLSRQAGVRFAISQLETLKGDLPAALRQVSQAINTGALAAQYLPEAYLQRGQLLFLEGRPQDAIRDLKSVVRIPTASAQQRGDAWVQLANCFEELLQPSLTVEAMDKAVQLGQLSASDAVKSMHNFGVRCNLRGESATAFEYFCAVVQREESSEPWIFSNALVNRGCNLADLGHYELAEDDFRRAVRFRAIPADVQVRAYFNLANLGCVTRQYNLAIRYFKKVLAMKTVEGNLAVLARCKLAHSYERSGREEQALEILAELLPIPVIEPREDYETVVFYAASTLMSCEQHEAAESLFQNLTSDQETSVETVARCKWSLGYMECTRTQSAQGLPAMHEARSILLKLGRNDLVRLVEQDIQKFELSV